ncbi:hypothetical protein RFI_06865 [Reticulomyxa filosa]|uniref:Uncharacterized protein n=1 Tax=Reticulomyxa filosa TaxID=46433 RepID=X6NW90_RETFI|nr:hypothetical protein RFI_06865 [Reticulomyxa filosa]|eukprot:ETO30256.1 hypothetical protein RFI_06865 [Reticulomyxa filosa]
MLGKIVTLNETLFGVSDSFKREADQIKDLFDEECILLLQCASDIKNIKRHLKDYISATVQSFGLTNKAITNEQQRFQWSLTKQNWNNIMALHHYKRFLKDSKRGNELKMTNNKCEKDLATDETDCHTLLCSTPNNLSHETTTSLSQPLPGTDILSNLSHAATPHQITADGFAVPLSSAMKIKSKCNKPKAKYNNESSHHLNVNTCCCEFFKHIETPTTLTNQTNLNSQELICKTKKFFLFVLPKKKKKLIIVKRNEKTENETKKSTRGLLKDVKFNSDAKNNQSRVDDPSLQQNQVACLCFQYCFVLVCSKWNSSANNLFGKQINRNASVAEKNFSNTRAEDKQYNKLMDLNTWKIPTNNTANEILPPNKKRRISWSDGSKTDFLLDVATDPHKNWMCSKALDNGNWQSQVSPDVRRNGLTISSQVIGSTSQLPVESTDHNSEGKARHHNSLTLEHLNRSQTLNENSKPKFLKKDQNLNFKEQYILFVYLFSGQPNEMTLYVSVQSGKCTRKAYNNNNIQTNVFQELALEKAQQGNEKLNVQANQKKVNKEVPLKKKDEIKETETGKHKPKRSPKSKRNILSTGNSQTLNNHTGINDHLNEKKHYQSASYHHSVLQNNKSLFTILIHVQRLS